MSSVRRYENPELQYCVFKITFYAEKIKIWGKSHFNESDWLTIFKRNN